MYCTVYTETSCRLWAKGGLTIDGFFFFSTSCTMLRFILDLKLKCRPLTSMVTQEWQNNHSASFIHRLLKRQHFNMSSASIRQLFYSAILQQPFRTIWKHLGVNSGTVGILRLLIFFQTQLSGGFISLILNWACYYPFNRY